MTVAQGTGAPSGTTSAFVARFDERLRALGFGGADDDEAAVVALSGGLDSCVLLHLLRFSSERRRVSAAHFDHGMRAESDADRAWVTGLCRAWGVPLITGRASSSLDSEGAARDARYDFLHSAVASQGSSWLLTAHHADDQAETVLFRALRGSGIEGLRGIPESRGSGILRPLLQFWREELEGYAASVGLSWREDSTNEHLGFARNAIRHRVIPEVERLVAPGARAALVRLAALADENELAWSAIMPELLSRVEASPSEGGVSWDRAAFLSLDVPLRARVFRHMVVHSERPFDQATTRRAVDFVESARSGTRIEIGRGLELSRELDRMVLGRCSISLGVSTARGDPEESLRPDAQSSGRPLRIPAAGPGSGEALIGGRSVSVVWDVRNEIDQNTNTDTLSAHEAFPVDGLDFPLTVRSRAPGDRIRLAGGTRKVKKVLLEARIPASERGGVPLLVDGGGRVLWVPGVARTSEVAWKGEGRAMRIQIG